MRLLAYFQKTLRENIREWKILALALLFGPFFVYIMFTYFGAAAPSYNLLVLNGDQPVSLPDGRVLRFGEDLCRKWTEAITAVVSSAGTSILAVAAISIKIIPIMGKYFIGTAGWSYEDWKGTVYPASRPRGSHPLLFLAQYINIVEINSTFYRPASSFMALSWVKKVEGWADFLFAVKLHQIFTHQRKDFTQKDVDDFRDGIEPIRMKERLAAVLLQFPWSFVNTASHMDYLARLFGLFSDYPLAVEVRHSSWDSPGFYKLLEENKAAFCNIDQPLFKNSIPPSAISTNPDFAYVRFHGRNYKDWFRADAGRDDRYNYLYAKDELQEWIDRIKSLGQKSGKVFVITNNHYRGQAMANALQIKNMITGEKLDIPKLLLEQYPVLEEIVKKIKNGQIDLFKK